MVRFVETTEELNDTNLSRSGTRVFTAVMNDSRQLAGSDVMENGVETLFSKHQIIETDMRIKTANED